MIMNIRDLLVDVAEGPTRSYRKGAAAPNDENTTDTTELSDETLSVINVRIYHCSTYHGQSINVNSSSNSIKVRKHKLIRTPSIR